MAGSGYISNFIFGLVLLVAGLAAAKPVKHVWDFDFHAGNNNLKCPAAGGSKYVGPRGGQWHWGPISDISFEQCIQECGQLDGCFVATYTGTCYLKTIGNVKGKGYVKKNNNAYRVAIKLN
ncbi:uncharacterized protein LTR77_007579 [Saxophila tyrrhenica]|uniref:PAN-3 domain-containing protein n=1 Tax=Saxophila tyrrhenica TaxID=1690608 RepID=A0AAV9P695_9PEZI|nr:hypothetical protein LTR77_007579 [Saxophila tyrrhenica]